MTPATFKFTSRLTKMDYLKISLLILFSGWRIYAVMGLFCVGLLLYLADVTIIMLLFVAVFMALYLFIMIVKATSRNSRRFYLTRRFSFSRKGITGKTQAFDETISWEDVAEWKRRGSYYLLYFSRENFLAIPLRDVAAAGIDNFDERLTSWMADHSE